jgi:quercetin dioxygenase-like cupin family protein
VPTPEDTTAAPRILARTDQLTTTTGDGNTNGAIWKLQEDRRDLDSNIIALAPEGTIDAHTGPDLDVLIHVLAGSGKLTTELDTLELTPGALVWLPRRSRREFTAGPDGLRYLTVHQRRHALVLDAPPPRTTP